MERLKGYNIGSKTSRTREGTTSRYWDRILNRVCSLDRCRPDLLWSRLVVDWPQGEKGLTLWILLRILLWESIMELEFEGEHTFHHYFSSMALLSRFVAFFTDLQVLLLLFLAFIRFFIVVGFLLSSRSLSRLDKYKF